MTAIDRETTLVRPVHPGDARSLQKLFSEPTLLSCDRFQPGAGIDDFQAFADAPTGDQHRLLAVRNDRPVGLGILERPPRSRMAHLGRIDLLFPPEVQGNESSAEVLDALINLADDWLNLKRLEADIPAGATALQTLFRSAGFGVEGIARRSLRMDGILHDEIAMARLQDLDEQVQLKRPPATFPTRVGAAIASSEVVIRPMEDNDVDDLYEVFRAPENCRTTMQLPSQEIWLARQRVRQAPADMHRLVAAVDGRVVGMISLKPDNKACRAHVASLGMMVRPDYWNHGVGSRLMGEILMLAERRLDLKRIQLQVHTDNPAAIHLYEKFGFVAEGIRRFHTFGGGGWADSLFMARFLD